MSDWWVNGCLRRLEGAKVPASAPSGGKGRNQPFKTHCLNVRGWRLWGLTGWEERGNFLFVDIRGSLSGFMMVDRCKGDRIVLASTCFGLGGPTRANGEGDGGIVGEGAAWAE